MAGYGLNTYTMTERNVAAYEKTGVELDVPVFPVREACLEIYEKNPDINLYNAVLLHPLPEGTVLAAICHFVTLTGVNPKRLAVYGAPSSIVSVLKEAAYNTAYPRMQMPGLPLPGDLNGDGDLTVSDVVVATAENSLLYFIRPRNGEKVIGG